MSILTILEYPHPHLKRIAQPVAVFDAKLVTLVTDMFATMYTANGIGLAAPQVDVALRVVVMDIGEEEAEPRVFINPVIQVLTQEPAAYTEGCLSVPGYFEEIERPKNVAVSWQDITGNHYKEHAAGLLAVCIQHECDHLDGTLFIDYISPLKRSRVKSKMLKAQREAVAK